jgi:hypothetical protein
VGLGYICPQPQDYFLQLIISCLRRQLACAILRPFGVYFFLLGRSVFYQTVHSQSFIVQPRSMKSQYPIMTLRDIIQSSSMKHFVVHTRPESSWALGELRPLGSAQTTSMSCRLSAVQSSAFQCTNASQKCLQSSQGGQGRCATSGKDDVRKTRVDCFVHRKSAQRLCTTA